MQFVSAVLDSTFTPIFAMQRIADCNCDIIFIMQELSTEQIVENGMKTAFSNFTQ